MTYSHTIPLEIQISSDSLKGRTKHEKLAHGYILVMEGPKTNTYGVGREVEQFFTKRINRYIHSRVFFGLNVYVGFKEIPNYHLHVFRISKRS